MDLGLGVVQESCCFGTLSQIAGAGFTQFCDSFVQVAILFSRFPDMTYHGIFDFCFVCQVLGKVLFDVLTSTSLRNASQFALHSGTCGKQEQANIQSVRATDPQGNQDIHSRPRVPFRKSLMIKEMAKQEMMKSYIKELSFKFFPEQFTVEFSLRNKRLAATCSGRIPGACPPCVRLVSALSPLWPRLQTLSTMCPPWVCLVPALRPPCVRFGRAPKPCPPHVRQASAVHLVSARCPP